jgi:hypothetical protein
MFCVVTSHLELGKRSIIHEQGIECVESHVRFQGQFAIMSGPSKIIRKAQVEFPKIGNPPTYRGFLQACVQMPGNRQAFIGMDKDTLDAEYER